MRATKIPFVALAIAGVAAVIPGLLAAQEQAVVAHTVQVTRDGSWLQLELTDGSTIDVRFANGVVTINGDRVASYEDQSPLAREWRDILSRGGSLSTEELVAAIRELQADGTQQQAARDALRARLEALDIAEAARTEAAAHAQAAAQVAARAAAPTSVSASQSVSGDADVSIDLRDLNSLTGLVGQIDALRGQLDQVDHLGFDMQDARVHVGDVTVARGETVDRDLIVLAGDVSVFGQVNGNVLALDGDVIVRSNGRIEGDVVTVSGTVVRAGGVITGSVRTEDDLGAVARNATSPDVQRNVSVDVDSPIHIASLLGMFVALACIGFGFTFFMPQQMEVVADTVTDSFGKSFFTGMFAQPLLIPAFLVVLLGLGITIVGLLLIPIAIVAFGLGVVAAGVGGYLAVAQSIGARYLTRRMAQGHPVSITPYRSLVFGLIGLLAIWTPAVVLGWIPFVGQALAALAAIFTWVMVTAGFGAAILSRAGLRATLVRSGRLPALTDEFYWGSTSEHALPRSRART